MNRADNRPKVTSKPSPAQKDAHSSAAKVSQTSVSFGRVDAPTTPSTMGARIPPRIPQSVAVTISGPEHVDLAVQSTSAAAGMATVNGARAQKLAHSASVKLLGTRQTEPGAADNLRLTASVRGVEVGSSNAFSICAIPTTMQDSQGQVIGGQMRGVEAIVNNDSDSGQIADLDQVQISEDVELSKGTGPYAGQLIPVNSTFRAANVVPHGSDVHATDSHWLTSAGHIESSQLFIFNDARSGATGALVSNSGFLIRFEVTAQIDGALVHLFVQTTVGASARTVHSRSAQAGRGGATSGLQAVKSS